MFSISPSEFIVIALVALVVVGPARLLELSRKAGEIAGKVKAAADDLRSGLESELGDAAAPFREAGSELKAAGKDLVETTEGELRWVDDAALKPDAAAEEATNADASTDEEDDAE